MTARVPRVRCFWAVRPPEPSLAALGELVRTLKRPLAQLGLQVSWMTAESYHLTCAFLGDLAEEQVGEMTAHVEAQLRRAAPVAPRLQLGGIGVFPGPHRPQVVYADGQTPAAGAPLTALQAQLADWLSELGHPREERPFHPHLTIGRVRAAAPARSPDREAAWRALLAEHAGQPYGPPFSVDELILYQSELGAAGARYTPLVRLPLQAP